MKHSSVFSSVREFETWIRINPLFLKIHPFQLPTREAPIVNADYQLLYRICGASNGGRPPTLSSKRILSIDIDTEVYKNSLSDAQPSSEVCNDIYAIYSDVSNEISPLGGN